jgi:hypothetical protein
MACKTVKPTARMVTSPGLALTSVVSRQQVNYSDGWIGLMCITQSVFSMDKV